MGAFVTTMVPREPMNVPKRIPKVIRLEVLTFRVTKKHMAVHISVHMKLPRVSETGGAAKPEAVHIAKLITPQILHLDASDRKCNSGDDHI